MTSIVPDRLTTLFVTSECTPFAQVGGLGDVSAALPVALQRLGHRPHVVMPSYRGIERGAFQRLERRLDVPIGADVRNVAIWRGALPGDVPLYLIDDPAYFDRDGVYGPNGGAFPDNLQRFTLLSRAALALPSILGFEPDIVHANDWPTALVAMHARNTPDRRVPTVFTIHNVGYQGQFPLDHFTLTGLPTSELSPESLEHFGTMNMMKGAIASATMLTTVSPTYAREIQTQTFGCGLDGVLRARSSQLHGILNGIDTEAWDTSSDPWLPAHYSADDLSGKAACKASLQREAGLPERPEVPLFGLITRLTYQKGLDVLARALRRILSLDVQFVLLGAGDPEAEAFFKMASDVRSDRFHAWLGFHPALAHRIEAGCDFFVMPSRYEPCGLNQLYSLRYGTLPVVRSTGGLHDSVENYDESTGEGTGFKLHDLTPGSMYDVIGWAVSTWYDRPHHIAAMRRRAMAKDFSWTVAAKGYEQVYRRAIEVRRSDERHRSFTRMHGGGLEPRPFTEKS